MTATVGCNMSQATRCTTYAMFDTNVATTTTVVAALTIRLAHSVRKLDCSPPAIDVAEEQVARAGCPMIPSDVDGMRVHTKDSFF